MTRSSHASAADKVYPKDYKLELEKDEIDNLITALLITRIELDSIIDPLVGSKGDDREWTCTNAVFYRFLHERITSLLGDRELETSSKGYYFDRYTEDDQLTTLLYIVEDLIAGRRVFVPTISDNMWRYLNMFKNQMYNYIREDLVEALCKRKDDGIYGDVRVPKEEEESAIYI